MDIIHIAPGIVIVSFMSMIYFLKVGIDPILGKMKTDGKSKIKIAITSVAVWIPILIVAAALIKL